MLEPGSAEGHRRSAALFGAGVSRRTGSSADESDCIDDSPISGCNVRSMIQTLETTPSSAMTSSGALEASSVTKSSSQTPTPQSSASTLNDEMPPSGSLKSKKLLGSSLVILFHHTCTRHYIILCMFIVATVQLSDRSTGRLCIWPIRSSMIGYQWKNSQFCYATITRIVSKVKKFIKNLFVPLLLILKDTKMK